MTETVLVAVRNDDDRRLEKLTESATDAVDPDGRVVVVHVFDQERYTDIRSQLNIPTDGEATPDDIVDRHSVSRRVTERLEDSDVDVEVRGAVGSESDAILEISDEVDAGLIIIGGRKRSPSGKALFGSTAQTVLLEADCPVTFVKDRSTVPA